MKKRRQTRHCRGRTGRTQQPLELGKEKKKDVERDRVNSLFLKKMTIYLF